MKIARTFFFASACLILFSLTFFTSCTSESESGEAGSYWNSNDLVRQQLKGKVKTITKNGDVEYYNTQGYIDSLVSGTDFKMTYSYRDSRILSRVEVANVPYIETRSNYYTYATDEQYIPVYFDDLSSFTFMQGLKSLNTRYYPSTYFSYTQQYRRLSETTIVADVPIEYNLQHDYITYSGKFPVSSEIQFIDSAIGIGVKSRYLYSPQGELSAIERVKTHSNSITTSVQHFSQIGNYLLMDTVSVKTTTDAGTISEKTVYTFDRNGFLLKESYAPDNYKNYTYNVTDSQGNWTRRTCFSRLGTNYNTTVETRSITYYD